MPRVRRPGVLRSNGMTSGVSCLAGRPRQLRLSCGYDRQHWSLSRRAVSSPRGRTCPPGCDSKLLEGVFELGFADHECGGRTQRRNNCSLCLGKSTCLDVLLNVCSIGNNAPPNASAGNRPGWCGECIDHAQRYAERFSYIDCRYGLHRLSPLKTPALGRGQIPIVARCGRRPAPSSGVAWIVRRSFLPLLHGQAQQSVLI